MSFMDEPFYEGVVLGVKVSLYGWKVFGLVGGLMFMSRWIVQAVHRKRTGSREIPTLFWWLSLIGAGMTLIYFTIGKTDMVGILGAVGPAGIAFWNLVKDLRQKTAGRSAD